MPYITVATARCFRSTAIEGASFTMHKIIEMRCPEFRIVDFGTSYFTSSAFSLKRHWNTFNKLFVSLTHPFDINTLWAERQPRTLDALAQCQWYASFLAQLPRFLQCMGLPFLATPLTFIYFDRWDGWYSYPVTEPEPYPNKSVERKLRTLKEENSFAFDLRHLGTTWAWQDIQVKFESGTVVDPDYPGI